MFLNQGRTRNFRLIIRSWVLIIRPKSLCRPLRRFSTFRLLPFRGQKPFFPKSLCSTAIAEPFFSLVGTVQTVSGNPCAGNLKRGTGITQSASNSRSLDKPFAAFAGSVQMSPGSTAISLTSFSFKSSGENRQSAKKRKNNSTDPESGKIYKSRNWVTWRYLVSTFPQILFFFFTEIKSNESYYQTLS